VWVPDPVAEASDHHPVRVVVQTTALFSSPPPDMPATVPRQEALNRPFGEESLAAWSDGVTATTGLAASRAVAALEVLNAGSTETAAAGYDAATAAITNVLNQAIDTAKELFGVTKPMRLPHGDTGLGIRG